MSDKTTSACDTQVCTRARVSQNPNMDLNHNLPKKLFKCKTHTLCKDNGRSPSQHACVEKQEKIAMRIAYDDG